MFSFNSSENGKEGTRVRTPSHNNSTVLTIPTNCSVGCLGYKNLLLTVHRWKYIYCNAIRFDITVQNIKNYFFIIFFNGAPAVKVVKMAKTKNLK